VFEEQPGSQPFAMPLQALTGTPGVQAGLVATDDGLPIAMHLQPRQDGDVLAATAAAVGRAAANALSALGGDTLELGVFDAEQFRLMVRPLSIGFLLVLAELDANVGLIAVGMASAAAELEKVAADVSGETMQVRGDP
jgi:predicted regulator of Ras-like GTPase activity (Roadblock/LC7/MglB family)